MKQQKPLVLVLPGSIDAKTMNRMRNAGYLVVETPDLQAVQVVNPTPLLPADRLAGIALQVVLDKKIGSTDIRNEYNMRVMRAALEQHGLLPLQGAQ